MSDKKEPLVITISFLVVLLIIAFAVHTSYQFASVNGATSTSQKIFGGLAYFFLFEMTFELVYHAFAELYDWKRKTIFNTDRFKYVISKKELFFLVALSYLFIIYSFAITYFYVANHRQNSFDKPKVDFIDTLYLSFTSVSVGPSGIQPLSSFARFLVMGEILIGLLYAILVFSFVASILQSNSLKKPQ